MLAVGLPVGEVEDLASAPLHGPSANDLQASRLRELSDWLQSEGRKLMLEVIVPGERSGERIAAAIRALQDAGVEPDVWKVEGLARPQDCLPVSAQARAEGRRATRLIVLGAGADPDAVERWLRAAAVTPGYAGFAVGRTIWGQAVADWAQGSLAAGRAAARVAERYLRMVEAYEGGQRS